MRLLLSLLYCGLLGLAVSAQAGGQPDVRINLSRQLDHQCDGSPESGETGEPGDCILYRIEVENKGDAIARQVKVQAHIPEYTILKRPFERIPDKGLAIDTSIEQMGNGLRVIKTRLDELAPGQQNRVVLVYEVQVL